MMRFSSILFLFCLLLSSCMQIQAPEVKSVACCDLKKVGKSQMAVVFDLEVHNGNSFPIMIKRHDIDVMMEGAIIGSSKDSQTRTLEPGSTQSVEVAVELTSEDLARSALTMGLSSLLNKKPKQLEVEIVGSVVGSVKGFSKRVRIREKYPINLQL